MIVDNVRNIGLYKGLSPLIDEALAYIETEDFLQEDEGQCEIQGLDLYYILQRYTTEPIETGQFESHRRYVDIQLVVSGNEIIGYSDIDQLKSCQKYDFKSDLEFYERPDRYTMLECRPGTFAILWPQDGHMPCRISQEQSDVCKVVFKVKCE